MKKLLKIVLIIAFLFSLAYASNWDLPKEIREELGMERSIHYGE